MNPTEILHHSGVHPSTTRRANRSMATGGVINKDHIRSLEYSPIKTLSASSETLASSPINMALLNARSLSNKSFTLNDFFSSKDLDFLFLSEMWLTTGDVNSLEELTLASCTFKNSPRSVGHSGGLATVYRNQYHCKLLPVDGFSSFEVHLMKNKRTCPVFCALIYRPPKYNKDFIVEFSEFLSSLVTFCDKLLILGDFNIHVCCTTQSLVNMVD